MNQDIDQEILRELRKLRRSSQWSVYLSLLCVGALAAYFAYARSQLLRSRVVRDVAAYQHAQQPASDIADTGDLWTQIQAALDRGDNRKAISIAQSFVARQPGYYYSHASLGSVYVAMNDFTNAEAAYMRVVELYPAEEYEKTLAAIRKRLARERATPAQAR